MIYGPLQERNFLCRAPNLRGYGERSHWPYKYHGPSTESRWIFILLKKKIIKKKQKKKNVSLVWFMICRVNSARQHLCFWALLLGQCNGKTKKEKKTFCHFTLITRRIDNNQFASIRRQLKQLVVLQISRTRDSGKWRVGCSQVLGSMPCFTVVTFCLPLDSLCDMIPWDWKTRQTHFHLLSEHNTAVKAVCLLL